MDEEWLSEKLKNLKIEENRISTLTEIRGNLNETLKSDTEVVELLLTSAEIFDCLDDVETTDIENSKLMTLIIEILDTCMANLPLTNNGDLFRLLHTALLHNQKRVRKLALNTVMREIRKQKEAKKEISDIVSLELVHHVLFALQHGDVHIGQTAYNILCMILDKYIDEPSVKDEILEALKENDIVKCRLYDVAVELGTLTPATLAKVEFILDHAVSELDNDDIVMFISILEIFGTLTKHETGISYLEKRQVFEVLSKRIEEMDYSPLDRILIPSLLKFFGCRPKKTITEHPHVMRFLFLCFYNVNCDLLPTAFDTLINLTQTEEDVVLLERQYATSMNIVFQSYANFLKDLPTDLKVRAFDSLKYIFLFENCIGPDISVVLQRWFNHLSNSTNNLQFLMDFCKTPFTDIKLSALGLISSICCYTWGIEALRNTAGFVEYLLDRNTQLTPCVKSAIFNIIKRLADSNYFDVHTNIQLNQYVNEGPYYLPQNVEVAADDLD